VLVVKRHERLNSKKGDTKMLTMRYDMAMDNGFIDAGTRGILVFELLDNGVIDYVASLY
jgi:hypothetical protein